MGKATRTLAMAGMALFASVAVGAGPAMAAAPTSVVTTVSSQVAAKPAAATTAPTTAKSRDRVVGYYRNLRSCDLAGRSGERHGRWNNYDCERVRSGHRRGVWALEVNWGHGNWGHGGHGNGHNNNGHGHSNNGHGHGNSHGHGHK
jgi:hypothetical protein